MFKSFKTIGVVLIAGVLVIAGVIAAAGWTQAAPTAAAANTAPQSQASGILHLDAGKYIDLALKTFEGQLGIDDAQLNAAFTGAVSDTLNQAVSDGLITADLASQANAFVKDGVTGLIGTFKAFMPKFGLGQAHQSSGPALDALKSASLASTLGLSSADFENELKSGKSIAAIAQEHHVDLAALQNTMLANVKNKLEAVVGEGKLTQGQADQIYAALSMKLNAIAAGKSSANSSAKSWPLLKDIATIDRAKYANLFITAFESHLGIDDAKLNAAFSATASAITAQAVTDGILTSDQATQINNIAQKMDVRQLAAMANKFPLGAFGGMRNPLASGWKPEAFAAVLGMSSTDLEAQLKAGKSIADIAAAQHLDLTQVKQAIQTQFKAQLDTAVKNGKLTQTLADQIYAQLTAKLDTLITKSLSPQK